MKPIIISVEGGVITGVSFHPAIPDDICVVIKDFDIEGIDPDAIQIDKDGNEYLYSRYDKESDIFDPAVNDAIKDMEQEAAAFPPDKE